MTKDILLILWVKRPFLNCACDVLLRTCTLIACLTYLRWTFDVLLFNRLLMSFKYCDFFRFFERWSGTLLLQRNLSHGLVTSLQFVVDYTITYFSIHPEKNKRLSFTMHTFYLQEEIVVEGQGRPESSLYGYVKLLPVMWLVRNYRCKYGL